MSVPTDKSRDESVTRERFLREIAARIPVDQITELHVFPPMRQSGMESGVAVIAAIIPLADAPEVVSPEDGEPRALSQNEDHLAAARSDDLEADSQQEVEATSQAVRHTVFSAHYTLVLKGPDRGKWDLDVTAEADAPLVSVDAVVRGVMKRAGEPAEPERLTGSMMREILEHDTQGSSAP